MEQREQREAIKQDMLRAWEDYQRTGLHVPHEEADAWLAKLEAGIDTDPPVATTLDQQQPSPRS